jgi:DNA-binding XRE family transcriptional regulator
MISSKLKANYAHNLRRIREQHGISQARLATWAGVSTRTVTHHEAETRIPRWDVLLRYAKALGYSPVDFLNELEKE